jgi:hypothetical protein
MQPFLRIYCKQSRKGLELHLLVIFFINKDSKKGNPLSSPSFGAKSSSATQLPKLQTTTSNLIKRDDDDETAGILLTILMLIDNIYPFPYIIIDRDVSNRKI